MPGPRSGTAANHSASTPFGPRLHAMAVYLKIFQALSYERLQKALFDAGRDVVLSALPRATDVASDETGVRIEGTNSYH
jgi:transposase